MKVRHETVEEHRLVTVIYQGYYPLLNLRTDGPRPRLVLVPDCYRHASDFAPRLEHLLRLRGRGHLDFRQKECIRSYRCSSLQAETLDTVASLILQETTEILLPVGLLPTLEPLIDGAHQCLQPAFT